MHKEATHIHTKTGKYLSIKKKRPKISTFYVLDIDGNICYMDGWLRRFEKICLVMNDEVKQICKKQNLLDFLN